MSPCVPVSASAHCADESTHSHAGTVLSEDEPVLNRRALRQVLNRALGTPAELDAFLIDYYPDVYRQTSSGMERDAKLNILLLHAEEEYLTRLLRNQYPQYVEDTMQQPEPAVGELREESPRRVVIVLSATIEEVDRDTVVALLRHLRRYTEDSELTIENVRKGSVILVCNGSRSAVDKLKNDYVFGHLNQLLDFPIQDIYFENASLPKRRPRRVNESMHTVSGFESSGPRNKPSFFTLTDTLTNTASPVQEMAMLARGAGSRSSPTLKIASRFKWTVPAASALVSAVCMAVFVLLPMSTSWQGSRVAAPVLVDAAEILLESQMPNPQARLSTQEAPPHSEPEHPGLTAIAETSRPVRAAPSAATASPIKKKPVVRTSRPFSITATCSSGTFCDRIGATSQVERCLRSHPMRQQKRLGLPANHDGELSLTRMGSHYVYQPKLSRPQQSEALDVLLQCVESRLKQMEHDPSRWPLQIQVRDQRPVSVF